jgi:hypothetical protein
MCGLLLIHTGWPSVAAAAGLAGVGLAMGRRRPSRGTDASPLAPGPEDGRGGSDVCQRSAREVEAGHG